MFDKPDLKKLLELRKASINKVLDLHKAANAGHISSSLSCIDLVFYLHFLKMKPGDKFILSKGHSATALYAVLNQLGNISATAIKTFYKDGTLLAAHPPCGLNKINGIIFGTGSLGHGLSLAAGLALANKFARKKQKVYCLISDGECNEGSVWEAALFAGHHNLNNLTVLIDKNGLQAFGKTREVMNLEPLEKKWRSFNFEVKTANGHDFNSLDNAFKKLSNKNKPKCIIAKTDAKISFMKNKIEWHYLPMDEEHYKIAKKEINKK